MRTGPAQGEPEVRPVLGERTHPVRPERPVLRERRRPPAVPAPPEGGSCPAGTAVGRSRASRGGGWSPVPLAQGRGPLAGGERRGAVRPGGASRDSPEPAGPVRSLSARDRARRAAAGRAAPHRCRDGVARVGRAPACSATTHRGRAREGGAAGAPPGPPRRAVGTSDSRVWVRVSDLAVGCAGDRNRGRRRRPAGEVRPRVCPCPAARVVSRTPAEVVSAGRRRGPRPGVGCLGGGRA